MTWTVPLLATAVAATLSAAPQQPAPQADPNDKPITITGCVAQGKDADTFQVTNARLTSGMPPASGDQIYLKLDSTRQLKEHVGHQVSISGTADFKEPEKGSAESKMNDDSIVKVSLPSAGKTNTPVGTSGKAEVATYKLDVKNVTMSSPSCTP